MLSIATKNGIILAAESRANFYNEQNRPVAYYDVAEKVFRINDRIGLATINNEFIGGKLLSIVLEEFIHLKGKKVFVDNVHNELFDFLAEHLPNNAVLIEKQQFIIGGYKGDIPIRICKDGSGDSSIRGS